MSSANRRAELLALYQDVDAEIAAENPRCDVSGRCCRFSEFGHSLFLSAPEAEWLFSVEPERSDQRGECPYQIGGRCTARERRPLGCRIYFCDVRYAERMVEISESAIRRLKDLHERWGEGWDYQPLERFLENFRVGVGPAKPKDRSLPILDPSTCKT
jgi:Fe-S-cluster containining protein